MIHQTEVELVAWQAGGSTQSIVVKSNQSVLIGRSNNCGLRLSGHSVSDIHCRIGFEEGQLWVQDWMSAAGTKVNGDPVTTKTYFGQGCVVEIGTYRIQVSKADAAKHETESSEEGEHHALPSPAGETASVPVASRFSRTESSTHQARADGKNESFSKVPVMTNKQLSSEQDKNTRQDAVDMPARRT